MKPQLENVSLQGEPEWKKEAERSHVLIIRLMVRLSLLAGRKLTRPIVYAIALFYFLLAGQVRQHSARYLKRALGRSPSLLERYRHFLYFSSIIHDRIFLLRNQFSAFEVRAYGFEPTLEDHAKGIPLLMMGAHIGSFEALRAIGESLGCPTTMLMYQENASKLNLVLDAIALPPKPRVIPLQNIHSMLMARDDLLSGHAIGMLADRRLGADSVYRSNFLGKPALLPENPFRLAAILKCRLYFMVGLYEGGNRYDLFMLPLADFSNLDDANSAIRTQRIKEAEANYVEKLEWCCHRSPFNWFNFFDFWAHADEN